MSHPRSLDEQPGASSFMLKEIEEQPTVVRSGLKTWLNPVASDFLPIQLRLPRSFYTDWSQVQILACGTSLHAGLIGQYWLEQLAGLPTRVRSAAGWLDAPPPPIPRTLAIALTQSGETADVLAALDLERQRTEGTGQQFLGITNRSDSSLRSRVDHLLPIQAGSEVAIAATKTFTAQLLVLCCLALDLAYRRQSLPPARFTALLNGLQQLPAQMEQLLAQQAQLQHLAQILAPRHNCVLLGRGLSFPIALEGALKLKETCYLHAEGYLMGEFLHGPVALLDETVPVIAIVPGGAGYEQAIANLHKIKARGCSILGIAPAQAMESSVFDQVIALPEVDEWLSPFLSVVPLQLLAYAIAVQRGLDVDHPRSLKKSLAGN